ncbi:hypothetical protein BGX20_000129 [Mortierella sp. AD010]|nr:hypothetical protein BGX20_000129 [Mortierella sp. AD010]
MNTVSEWIETCAAFDGASFVFPPRNQQPFLLQNQPQLQYQPQLQDPQQQQQQQQQVLHPYNCNSVTNIQHEINNDMLVTMTLAASPSVPSPTAAVASGGDPVNNSSNAFSMTSLGLTRPVTSIDYHDPSILWSQLGITEPNNIIDGNGSSGSSSVSFPLLSFSSNELSPRGQMLDANGNHLSNQFEATSLSNDPSLAQQLPSATSCPSTPILASHASFAATVDEMALNPMGAHEQFTAILYSWSHQLGNLANAKVPSNTGSTLGTCANSAYSPSSSTPSPALSTSSSFTTSSVFTASPSLAPSMYSPSLLSSSFSKLNTSSTSDDDDKNNVNALTHNFIPRSSSKFTRRLLQASPLEPTSSSSSSAAALMPGSMFRRVSTRSWSSPPALPLTCQVCRKQYANNSTLRRHLKIHVYANNSARALATYRANNTANANVNANTSAGAGVNKSVGHQAPANHRPSLCSEVSSMSIVDQSPTDGSGSTAPGSTMTTTSASLMTQGYIPSSDPYLKKPECVGCNKAFARRDTVILHIKNQKRKWDLLNAILPTLIGIASPTDLPAGLTNATGSTTTTSTSALGTAAAASAGITSSIKNKRSQRQRRSHPHRMVEKLWHSTLQRKGVFLSSGNNNKNGKGQALVKKEAEGVEYNRGSITRVNSNSGNSGEDDEEGDDTFKIEEEEDSSDEADNDDEEP